MLALFMIAVGSLATDSVTLCEAPHIVSDAALPETWRAELGQLCQAFSSAPEIDRTAHLDVCFNGAELVIEAQTVDGRRGLRRVRRPEMLYDVLEALLALPLAPPEPPAPPPEPQPTPAPVSEPARHAIVPRLGLGISTRGADGGRFSIGPSAIAALYVDDWLVGVSLRWDAIANSGNNSVSGYEATAVAFGLTIGRRLYRGSFDLDAAFEPRLASESQSRSEGSSENGVTVTDFWFGGILRITFGHGSIRPYMQLDADFAPSRLRADIRGDAIYAPLPTWGTGLAVGAAWTIE